MGYLPGFDQDVFISYAHLDDDTHFPETSGWVAQFHADLVQYVTGRLGQQAQIWRDCEIRSNEDFDRKIRARLVRTATFLSIMSPSFMKREWCLMELQKFTEQAQQNLGVLFDGEKSRIFKVEKLPTERRNLPVQLQGTGGYKFYRDHPDRPGQAYVFRPILGGDYVREYLQRLEDLAGDIVKVMEGMAGISVSRTGGPQLGVYLAETTSDLDSEASEIRRDLKSRGYAVFPQGDMPYRAADFSAKVREYLSRSVLSVQLVGNEYGMVPEGEREKSNAWLQTELALERGTDPGFRRVIWMPRGVSPADARQQSFLEYLTQDAVQKRAEVLENNLEDVKTTILESLAKAERERQAPRVAVAPTQDTAGTAGVVPSPHEAETLVRIYVICDRLDRKTPDFQALRAFLFDQGYEPLWSRESEAEDITGTEVVQAHAENLAICDACLIYYGRGSANWFHTKLMDLRKNLTRREKPVFAKGVYVAPPQTDDKSELQTHEALVMRAGENFSPDPLAPFLKRIAEASAGKRS
jgi:TIR domain